MREPTTRMWISGRLDPAVQRALQRLQRLEDVQRIAVMPDVHLSADVCVGTVLATTRLLYPAAVGGDIGCGMAAVPLDVEAQALRSERCAARVLAGLYERIPANRHRRPQPLPRELCGMPLSDERLTKLAGRDGAVQLGTLGRGNHFLELQADEQDRLWLMVHSGSRAIGPAIRDHHLAGSNAGGLTALDGNTAVGQAYLADMHWAIAYARHNRRRMLDATVAALGDVLGTPLDTGEVLDCDHNHIRNEEHQSRRLYVHRKGALSAGLGELGIIPGSMGTESFLTEGRGEVQSLCSSSHGAGRQFSRHEARQRISSRNLQRQMGDVWFDRRRSDHLRDEAPGAYRDIRQVMHAQRALTRIVRRLRPIMSYKG